MYVWADNLTTCKKLLDLQKDESVQFSESESEGINRLIISKSYYACFNKIRELNKSHKLNPTIRGSDSHVNTIDCIREYPRSDTLTAKKKSDLIQRMKELKEYRKKADYDLGNNHMYSIDYATNVFKRASKTFEELNNC